MARHASRRVIQAEFQLHTEGTMADRFEYDRDRYGAGREYGRDRDRVRDEDRWRREREDERGVLERAGDEVRSWFGDDEAARRRQQDEGREDSSEQGWTRGRGSGREYSPESGAEPGRGYGRRPYGTERGYAAGEDVGRSSRAFSAGRGRAESRRETERPGWGRSAGEGGRSWSERERPERSRIGEWGTAPDWGTSHDWGVARDDRWPPGGGYAASPLAWAEPGPYTGRGPRDYRRSDDRIREDICDRLTRHGRLDATDLRVQVQNGEVTLDGTVDTRDMKRMAEDVAEDVDGVRDVVNHLKTNRGETPTSATRASTGKEHG